VYRKLKSKIVIVASLVKSFNMKIYTDTPQTSEWKLAALHKRYTAIVGRLHLLKYLYLFQFSLYLF
jgi:hypothetical protein